MGGLMDHAEASELLGAYALDAVEPHEAAAVEAHLETCPRCRDELRNHREVVGLLAYAGQDAPEGMWDRVVARINDPGDAAAATFESPHALRLVRVDGPVTAGPPPGRPGRDEPGRGVTPPAAPAPTGHAPGRTARWGRFNRTTGLVAAAAVVVVALLGAEVANLQSRTGHLQTQISAMSGAPSMATVRQSLAVPGARRVALAPVGGGAAQLDAVILPGGQGYLYDSRLAPLPAARTYQLWGVVGGQRISYGVLGSSPGAVMPFRASDGVQALAVTAEVAGGVVSSTQRPVAVGVIG